MVDDGWRWSIEVPESTHFSMCSVWSEDLQCLTVLTRIAIILTKNVLAD